VLFIFCYRFQEACHAEALFIGFAQACDGLKTTGGIAARGFDGPMVVDGAINGDYFRAYSVLVWTQSMEIVIFSSVVISPYFLEDIYGNTLFP